MRTVRNCEELSRSPGITGSSSDAKENTAAARLRPRISAPSIGPWLELLELRVARVLVAQLLDRLNVIVELRRVAHALESHRSDNAHPVWVVDESWRGRFHRAVDAGLVQKRGGFLGALL